MYFSQRIKCVQIGTHTYTVGERGRDTEEQRGLLLLSYRCLAFLSITKKKSRKSTVSICGGHVNV